MPETEHLELYKKFLILVIFIFFSGLSYSQVYPDSTIDNLLRTGINFVITQKYDNAEIIFEKIEKNYPKLPLGKIYLAALKIVKSNDYGNDLNDNSIAAMLDSAQSQSKRLLADNSSNVWNRYFLALSEGYYAYFKALKKSWIPAFKNGLDAVSDFKKCLIDNPNFFDAYAAIGTYKYWKSRKTEFLQWLPFIDNEENLGIKYLKAAIKKSSYNRYLAMNSLIWIYIDQKRYGNAVSLAKTALKSYPDSRYFMWGLARAYEDYDKKEAIKVYSDILISYKKIKLRHQYKRLLLEYILAKLYYQIGDNANSLTMCNQILNYNVISDYDRGRLGKRLNKVREIKKELSE